jgi:hypothetical protein
MTSLAGLGKRDTMKRKIMDKPHQRKGSKSNSDVGARFEKKASKYFHKQGIELNNPFPLEVGVKGRTKKAHKFDLGSEAPKIVVECKSHTWTEGDKVPVAKMTTWNQAMYYFLLCPKGYRKVLFVKHDKRRTTGETLLGYYLKTYRHLIPKDVEFIEYDEKTNAIEFSTKSR